MHRALDLLLRGIARQIQQLFPCGKIEDPRRLNGIAAEELSPFIPQRKEIEQHLQAEPVAQLREVKALRAGLVVHHAQKQLTVLEPAVHAVDLADHAQLLPRLADGHGWELSVRAEAQLKGQRLEIGVGKLLHRRIHDAVDRLAQPAEKIAEARVLPVKVGEIFFNVCTDRLPHKRVQRRTLQRLEAAALARRAERVLHHVVDKGADLRRVEARSCALLRAQAVLHEVGEMAAPRLVHARGAERDAAPVERVDGLT